MRLFACAHVPLSSFEPFTGALVMFADAPGIFIGAFSTDLDQSLRGLCVINGAESQQYTFIRHIVEDGILEDELERVL